MATRQAVTVDGHRLRVTNLDKVLYPVTGTTKRDVLAYWQAVAAVMIPQVARRPATRKRWPDGVGTDEHPGTPFFRKNLEDSAPDWVPRMELEHSDHTNVYPLVEHPAVLAWFGQVGALEVHVPQWRFGEDGSPGAPDRLVLDLDPGPGVELPQIAEIARWCREILDDMGLASIPVTSGSKGIHLYAALDGTYTSQQVSEVAHELARSLEADHPDEVVSEMKKSRRTGKVLIDWSQNNRNKTTVAPYSLRGRSHPNVAAPRTWEELEDPGLAQLDYQQVMERVADGFDPLEGFGAAGAPEGGGSGSPAPEGTGSRGSSKARGGAGAGRQGSPKKNTGGKNATRPGGEETPPQDSLSVYRSKRDASRTPEPVPQESPSAGEDDPIFVIQEHHARRLHYDTRLEHDGVLVSWAVPKGPPLRSGTQRLAVQTEDHPMEYATFEGRIPKGEYGAGEVGIWDSGTVEIEKWEDGKVVAVLHGQPDGGLGGRPRRYALIRTDDESGWIIRLTKDQPEARGGSRPGGRDKRKDTADTAATGASSATRSPSRRRDASADRNTSAQASVPDPLPQPMLATAGSAADVRRDDWVFEGKWDGYRVVAGIGGDGVELRSRNGTDLTGTFPELAELSELVPPGTVLDGEVVALGRGSRPDFGLLQMRGRLTSAREVEQAMSRIPVYYMVFDVLHTAEHGSLRREPYTERRAVLRDLVNEGAHVQVPGDLGDSLDDALDTSKELQLEGVLAKKAGSVYRAGRRSRDWIKIKTENHQEVVVIGWRRGKGSRSRSLGSLLVAVPGDDGRLHYAGRVGTGFGSDELDELRATLEKMTRKTAPAEGVPREDASDATWVRPKFVGEVKHSGRTRDGRLRQPVWRGFRPDKAPDEVVWEAPAEG